MNRVYRQCCDPAVQLGREIIVFFFFLLCFINYLYYRCFDSCCEPMWTIFNPPTSIGETKIFKLPYTAMHINVGGGLRFHIP